ncbi:MAG: hypothetical protein HY287_02540 [Planctomycetes bacterium]|nr:hypothetical protein [Planctomycetota bacterium]MBI3833188.1 hypothetical protein [Planctomycetota bacterium]
MNAFEQELLKWQITGMRLRWDQDNPAHEKLRNGQRVVPFQNIQLRREHNQEFIDSTSQVLGQVHTALAQHAATVPDADRPAFAALAAQISKQLSDQCVVTTLKDVRDAYLREVLASEDAYSEFVEILKDLGGAQGKLYSSLNDPNRSPDPHVIRRRLTDGIEILQTLLFNAPGFCSDCGLLVLREDVEDTHVYLFLGFDEDFGPDLERYNEFASSFDLIVMSVRNLLKHARPEPRSATDERDDLIVHHIMRTLQNVGDASPSSGLYRFIRLALRLSRESVHEGHEIQFLLGHGHAETPQLRSRRLVIAPPHLTAKGIAIDVVVHFIKSYFSLLACEDCMLWFDEEGRFHGSYGPAVDGHRDWFAKWGSGCHFVRIRGKGRLDVLEATQADGDPQPRVRVIGDSVVDLQSIAAIEYVTTLASGFVFAGDEAFAHSCGRLTRAIMDRLREEERGAGLVIANLDVSSQEVSWRLGIVEQMKPLVAELPEFDEPVVRLASLVQGRVTEKELGRIVDRVARLADLDGAVFLACRNDGTVRAYPARHFFPLVRGDKGAPQLLDFYKWVELGRALSEAKAREALESVDQILRTTAAPVPDRELARMSGARFLERAMDQARKLRWFSRLDQLYAYCAYIAGHLRKFKDQEPESAIRGASDDLSFLTSAGTRHHSLWGITLSSRERVFVVSLSHDGRVSVFWDGRLIASPTRGRH